METLSTTNLKLLEWRYINSIDFKEKIGGVNIEFNIGIRESSYND